MRAACCWCSARIITRFYSHRPLPSSKGLISLSGLGKCWSNCPVRSSLWLHTGEVGCLAQPPSTEVKFTFTPLLPRRKRVSIKWQWPWNTERHLLLTNVNCQPGSRQARGSKKHNRGEGITEENSDLPRESEVGSEWSIWKDFLLVVLFYQVLGRAEKF